MNRSVSRSTSYLPRYQSLSPARSPLMGGRGFLSPRSTSQPRQRIVYIDNATSRLINSYHVHHSPSPHRTYKIHLCTSKTKGHLTRITRSQSASDINSSHVYTSQENLSVGSLRETASRQVGSSEDIYHAVPFFPDVTPSESGVSFGEWEEGSTFGAEDDNVSQHSFGSSSAFCEVTVDSELDKCDSDNFSGPDYIADRTLGILPETDSGTNLATKKRRSRRSYDGQDSGYNKSTGHGSDTAAKKKEHVSNHAWDLHKLPNQQEALSVLIPEGEIPVKTPRDIRGSGETVTSIPLAHSTPYVSPGGSDELKLYAMSSWDADAIGEEVSSEAHTNSTSNANVLPDRGHDTKYSSRFEDSSCNSSCSEDNYSDVSNVTTPSPVTRKTRLVKKHSDKSVGSKKNIEPPHSSTRSGIYHAKAVIICGPDGADAGPGKIEQQISGWSPKTGSDAEIGHDKNMLATDVIPEVDTSGSKYQATFGGSRAERENSKIVSGGEDSDDATSKLRQEHVTAKPLSVKMPLITAGKHGQEKLRKLSQMSPPLELNGSPLVYSNDMLDFGGSEKTPVGKVRIRQSDEECHMPGIGTSDNIGNPKCPDNKETDSPYLPRDLSNTSSCASENRHHVREVKNPENGETLQFELHSGSSSPAEVNVPEMANKGEENDRVSSQVNEIERVFAVDEEVTHILNYEPGVLPALTSSAVKDTTERIQVSTQVSALSRESQVKDVIYGLTTIPHQQMTEQSEVDDDSEIGGSSGILSESLVDGLRVDSKHLDSGIPDIERAHEQGDGNNFSSYTVRVPTETVDSTRITEIPITPSAVCGNTLARDWGMDGSGVVTTATLNGSQREITPQQVREDHKETIRVVEKTPAVLMSENVNDVGRLVDSSTDHLSECPNKQNNWVYSLHTAADSTTAKDNITSIGVFNEASIAHGGLPTKSDAYVLTTAALDDSQRNITLHPEVDDNRENIGEAEKIPVVLASRESVKDVELLIDNTGDSANGCVHELCVLNNFTSHTVAISTDTAEGKANIKISSEVSVISEDSPVTNQASDDAHALTAVVREESQHLTTEAVEDFTTVIHEERQHPITTEPVEDFTTVIHEESQHQITTEPVEDVTTVVREESQHQITTEPVEDFTTVVREDSQHQITTEPVEDFTAVIHEESQHQITTEPVEDFTTVVREESQHQITTEPVEDFTTVVHEESQHQITTEPVEDFTTVVREEPQHQITTEPAEELSIVVREENQHLTTEPAEELTTVISEEGQHQIITEQIEELTKVVLKESQRLTTEPAEELTKVVVEESQHQMTTEPVEELTTAVFEESQHQMTTEPAEELTKVVLKESQHLTTEPAEEVITGETVRENRHQADKLLTLRELHESTYVDVEHLAEGHRIDRNTPLRESEVLTKQKLSDTHQIGHDLEKRDSVADRNDAVDNLLNKKQASSSEQVVEHVRYHEAASNNVDVMLLQMNSKDIDSFDSNSCNLAEIINSVSVEILPNTTAVAVQENTVSMHGKPRSGISSTLPSFGSLPSFGTTVLHGNVNVENTTENMGNAPDYREIPQATEIVRVVLGNVFSHTVRVSTEAVDNIKITQVSNNSLVGGHDREETRDAEETRNLEMSQPLVVNSEITTTDHRGFPQVALRDVSSQNIAKVARHSTAVGDESSDLTHQPSSASCSDGDSRQVDMESGYKSVMMAQTPTSTDRCFRQAGDVQKADITTIVSESFPEVHLLKSTAKQFIPSVNSYESTSQKSIPKVTLIESTDQQLISKVTSIESSRKPNDVSTSHFVSIEKEINNSTQDTSPYINLGDVSSTANTSVAQTLTATDESSFVDEHNTANIETTGGYTRNICFTNTAVTLNTAHVQPATEAIHGLSHSTVPEHMILPAASTVEVSRLDAEAPLIHPSLTLVVEAADPSDPSLPSLSEHTSRTNTEAHRVDTGYVSSPAADISETQTVETSDSAARSDTMVHVNNRLHLLQAQLSVFSKKPERISLAEGVSQYQRDTSTSQNLQQTKSVDRNDITDLSDGLSTSANGENVRNYTKYSHATVGDDYNKVLSVTDIDTLTTSHADGGCYNNDYDNVPTDIPTAVTPVESQLARPHQLRFLHSTQPQAYELWALQEETESAMNTPSPKLSRTTFVSVDDTSNSQPYRSTSAGSTEDRQIPTSRGQNHRVSDTVAVEMSKGNMSPARRTIDSNSSEVNQSSREDTTKSRDTEKFTLAHGAVQSNQMAGELSARFELGPADTMNEYIPENKSRGLKIEVAGGSQTAATGDQNSLVTLSVDEDSGRISQIDTLASYLDVINSDSKGQQVEDNVSLGELAASLNQLSSSDMEVRDKTPHMQSSDSFSTVGVRNHDLSLSNTHATGRFKDDDVNKTSHPLSTRGLHLSKSTANAEATSTEKSNIYTCTGSAEIKRTVHNYTFSDTPKTQFKPTFKHTVPSHKLSQEKIRQFEKILYEFNRGLRTNQDITDFLVFCENYADYTDSSSSSSDVLYRQFTHDDSEKDQNHTCITVADENMNTFRFKRYLKKSHTKRNNGRKILRFLSKLSCVSETVGSSAERPAGTVKMVDEDAQVFRTDSMHTSKMSISHPVLISSTSFQLHDLLRSASTRFDNSSSSGNTSFHSATDSAYSSLSEPSVGSLSSPAFRHTLATSESVSSAFNMDVTGGTDWSLPDNVFSNSSDTAVRGSVTGSDLTRPELRHKSNMFSFSDDLSNFNFNFNGNDVDGSLLNRMRYGHTEAKFN